MPRRLPLLVASLLLAGCSMTPGGLSAQQLRTSLPAAAEVGPGWTLVGTTTSRPTDSSWDDALTEAAKDTSACHDALLALEQAQEQPAPARFARSIYRREAAGADSDRDLTLTLETFGTVPDRRAAIHAMTAACAEPMRLKAGVRTVTMIVRDHEDTAPGSVGYSVEYRTSGLSYSFDYLLARREGALVSASTTGPSSAGNQDVLRRAVTLAGGNLERARGATPTP